MKFEAYTDGSCLENGPEGGPGGYGIQLTLGDKVLNLKGGYFKTTNNRMEMMAIIKALEEFQEPVEITIHSDSQYTIDGITKWIYGWIRNDWVKADGLPVKNKDLWQRLHTLMKYHKVHLNKVKAHSGIPGNEAVDVLAKEAAASPTMEDTGFIPTPPDQKPVVMPYRKNKWQGYNKYKKK